MSFVIILAMILALVAWRQIFHGTVGPKILAEATYSTGSIEYGGTCELVITIRNPTMLPAPLVACEFQLPLGLSVRPPTGDDDGPLDEEERRVSVAVALKARESASIRYVLYGIKRGRQRIGEFGLALSDGFTPRHQLRDVNIAQSVIVHPRKEKDTLELVPVNQIGSMPSLRKLFPTSLDWVDMRPYRVGDSVRDISWTTSARHGELIVLERATTVAQHVIVVVSLQVADEFWLGDSALAEKVIASSYSLITDLLHQGAMFTLYTNAAVRQQSRSANRHALMMSEGPWSARLEFNLGHVLGALPIYSHVSLAAVLAEVGANALEPSRILVITGYESAATERAIARLTRAGHRVETVRIRQVPKEEGKPKTSPRKELRERRAVSR